MRRWVGMGAGAAVLAAAVGAMASGQAQAGDSGEMTAVLRDAAGHRVATVHFNSHAGKLWVTNDVVENGRLGAGFHGFHIHTNDDPANGSGCVADPAQPASTWFTAVDGHLGATATDQGPHGSHPGDMPNVLVAEDGSGRLQFATAKVGLDDLVGRAVILHAGPDNHGNIPLGDLPDQYKSNGADALSKTARTGNAGDRLACGLIEKTPEE